MTHLRPPTTQARRRGALLLLLAAAGCVSTPAPRLDVDSYTAQGWMLMRDGQPNQAVDLLQEGLLHYPEAFQIHVTLGQVLARQARQADQSLEPALATYRTALELGLQTRRRTLHTTWTEYQQTDLRDAARMITLLSRRTGATPPDTVHRYLDEVGSDPVIERNLPPHDSNHRTRHPIPGSAIH